MFVDEKFPGEIQDVTIEPWRKILLDAAQYLRDHGHCKERLFDLGGKACINGALYAATGRNYEEWNNGNACEARSRVFAVIGVGGQYEMVDWNNSPERTADEVINALELAARS